MSADTLSERISQIAFYKSLKKEVKMKRRQKVGYNYHHIKPKAIGGQSTDDNMLFLKMEKHCALHRMFGNASPSQIIKRLRSFERDFKTVFGNVSFEEAAKIYERMLDVKASSYWGV
jgi:excinuclease UvrABC helicase subunit UvrB